MWVIFNCSIARSYTKISGFVLVTVPSVHFYPRMVCLFQCCLISGSFYWDFSDDIINHKLTRVVFVALVPEVCLSTSFLLQSSAVGLDKGLGIQFVIGHWRQFSVLSLCRAVLPFGFPVVSMELNIVVVSQNKLPKNLILCLLQ